MQEQLEERSAARQKGLEQVGRPELLTGGKSPLFVEVMADPDLTDPDDPDDDLDKTVQTETSRQNVLANLSEEEFERQKILLQVTAEMIRREFIPRSGFGSKCTGEYRRILTGTPENQHPPVLTPDMARRIMSAVGEEGVKLEQLSGAIDGATKEALTQIQSSVYTDTGGQATGGGSSGGIAQSAKNLLGFS
jgi:hypothetical protein